MRRRSIGSNYLEREKTELESSRPIIESNKVGRSVESQHRQPPISPAAISVIPFQMSIAGKKGYVPAPMCPFIPSSRFVKEAFTEVTKKCPLLGITTCLFFILFSFSNFLSARGGSFVMDPTMCVS